MDLAAINTPRDDDAAWLARPYAEWESTCSAATRA